MSKEKASLVNWLQTKLTSKEYTMHFILEMYEKIEINLKKHNLKFNKEYPIILIQLSYFVFSNSDNIGDTKFKIKSKYVQTYNDTISSEKMIDIFYNQYSHILIDLFLQLKQSYHISGIPLLNTPNKSCSNDFIEFILYNINLQDVINNNSKLFNN